MILKCFEAGECSTSSNQLMAKLGLVVTPTVVVDLIIGVLRFAWWKSLVSNVSEQDWRWLECQRDAAYPTC